VGEASKVTVRIEDGIAVITIDNPPINAASLPVRAGLVEALRSAGAAGVSGAILIGTGRAFIAGSDLREFGQPLASPELPDVIRAVENAPFPVVAAIHGIALGGGFELALGCDYRVAASCTKVGLPEVSLGMVPGAGGTQRLTKLVGRARAIDLICGARRISAQEARDIGAIDSVVNGDLLLGAKAFLKAQDRPKRRVIDDTLPDEDANSVEAAAKRAIRRGDGRPNVAEAVRLVRLVGSGSPTAALADERATFQRFRLGPDAFALRYLFFAERRAGAVKGLNRTLARRVSRVAVIGGGTMGQGIAKAVLVAGLSVLIVERDENALGKALSAIETSLDQLVSKRNPIGGSDVRDKTLLHGATAIADTAGCDLVIEAVFEEMSVKRTVLAELDAVLDPKALIATNTSYLNIDEMSRDLAHPERVLGLHFFSPADRMTLLEIIRAERTSDGALVTGLAFAKALGKQAVVTRVAEGFIGNRIYSAYRRHAELLVLDGAAPETVDEAVRDFGFRMGPFEVSDLSGLDIARAMRKRLMATRDPAERYVTIPDRLCEAGRLGRKVGKGWYDYSTGNARPDPEVANIIAAARREARITPLKFDSETVQRRLLAVIVNEASWLIDEGIAQRASDVDVVFANGYGFPRWRGGPLYWAAQEDPDRLDADLAALGDAIGHTFRRGPLRRVLEQIEETTKAE
jgi:3-hydroxyacyl-CoA dehydrogenase